MSRLAIDKVCKYFKYDPENGSLIVIKELPTNRKGKVKSKIGLDITNDINHTYTESGTIMLKGYHYNIKHIIYYIMTNEICKGKIWFKKIKGDYKWDNLTTIIPIKAKKTCKTNFYNVKLNNGVYTVATPVYNGYSTINK